MKALKTIAFWVILYLIIAGLWTFCIEPAIDRMPCIDLSEDERNFYTDTWPPQ